VPRLVGTKPGQAELHLRALVKFALNYRGERRGIFRGYLFGFLSRLAPLVGVEGAAGTYLVSTNDTMLGRLTFQQREFDQDKLARVVELLRAEGWVYEGSTFVDIGANVGVTTLPALTVFGFSRAIAVEPAAENLRLLRATLELNDLSHRVTVVDAAMSDREGEVELELCEDNCGDHRVRVRPAAGTFEEERRPSVPVRALTLDALLETTDDIGLLWIDVQGHEGQVLFGGGSLLRRGIPTVVEYWPYALDRAGGHDTLLRVIGEHFSRVIDVSRDEEISSRQLPSLRAEYTRPGRRGRDQTDLLLLPGESTASTKGSTTGASAVRRTAPVCHGRPRKAPASGLDARAR
jgi:FkbM family methyltransferase